VLASPSVRGTFFRKIPNVELSLAKMVLLDADGERIQTTWRQQVEYLHDDEPFVLMVPVGPVDAIVITQNCDAVREECICLCRIEKYLAAIGQGGAPSSDEKWQSLITRKSRENPKVFYLPADPEIDFPERMGVDFRVVGQSELSQISQCEIPGFFGLPAITAISTD